MVPYGNILADLALPARIMVFLTGLVTVCIAYRHRRYHGKIAYLLALAIVFRILIYAFDPFSGFIDPGIFALLYVGDVVLIASIGYLFIPGRLRKQNKSSGKES